jgi:hypothetical protein
MYTAQEITRNGIISSVVRCASLAQLKTWAAANGHKVVTGKEAQQATRNGHVIRCLCGDGRVRGY